MKLWLIFLPLAYIIAMFCSFISQPSWHKILLYGMAYFILFATLMLSAIWWLAS